MVSSFVFLFCACNLYLPLISLVSIVFHVPAVFCTCFVDPVFSLFNACFLGHFHRTRTLSAFAKGLRIPVPVCSFSKLYFVFYFVPFFRF